MDFICFPDGFDLNSKWFLYNNLIVFTWVSHDLNILFWWVLYTLLIVFIYLSDYFHIIVWWFLHAFLVIRRWLSDRFLWLSGDLVWLCGKLWEHILLKHSTNLDWFTSIYRAENLTYEITRCSNKEKRLKSQFPT